MGILVPPIFVFPDRIKGKWLKFGVQMLLRVIIAAIAALGIAFFAIRI